MLIRWHTNDRESIYAKKNWCYGDFYLHRYYSSISGIANIQGNSVIITNDNNDTEDKVEGLLYIDNITDMVWNNLS